MIRRLLSLAGLMACLFLISRAPLAAQDTSPPTLVAWDFTPKAIDTTLAPATVTATLTATDDLSGVNFVNVVFQSPSGYQLQTGYANCTPGGTTCTASMNITFPQFGEAGIWTALYVQTTDTVGNSHRDYAADLDAKGFPTQLEVTSNQDVSPPTLTAWDFTPKAIDTTLAPATVTATLIATDDLSGINFVNVVFQSSSGYQLRTGYANCTPGGTTCTASMNITFPQFGEAGIWTALYVQTTDAVGNSHRDYAADLDAKGFPTQLEVTSNQDVSPPTLTACDFTPKAIDTTLAPAIVTATLTATDDLSGVNFVNVVFRSPSGYQLQTGYANCTSGGTTCTASMNITFPQFSEAGIWTALYVQTTDAVGNSHRDYAADLTAKGMPTRLWNGVNQLTALGPANMWIGLKNSDDVGTKFDLLADVSKNGSPVGSGTLYGVSGGASGFGNAVLRTINLALSSPVSLSSGETLSIKLSVRIAVGVPGHSRGTARLWFNDAAASSRFGATIGGTTNDYFLLNGTLGTSAGGGPKKSIDVLVDKAVGGNPFKPFGTWTKTF